MPNVVGVMLLRCAMLAQVGVPGNSFEAIAHSAGMDDSTPVAQTQSSTPAPAVPADARRQPATFRDTTFGQLFQGKKTLTPDEALQVHFWLGALRDLAWTAITFIPRLIVAGILLLMFYAIYCGVRRLMVGSLAKTHVDPSVRDMLGTVLKWAILGFGVVTACNQVGLQITGLLAGTAIIGLAIGFAAQETLANFIAGIVIFWDRPFKVGDWIDVDNRYGRVLRITFRSTRVLNSDGDVVIVPNTMMLASKLTNHSTHPLTRVKVPVRIPHSASIDDARERLISLADADSRICADPAPSVWMTECADDGVHLTLGFWVEDESIQRALVAEYLEKAKKTFDASGMPMPIRHVQLVTEPSSPTIGLRKAG